MGIKTFSVANPKLPQGPPSIEHPLTSPTSVALGRKGALGPWTLVSPTYNTFSDYEPREYLFLSVLIHEDAFPPPSPAGRAQFYMKTYSENEGMLPQLASAGILRDTGRTMKQGFATVPLCEVILEEGELARCCAGCEKWEVIDGQRFERCSRCKVEYYHSQECQTKHWAEHKQLCKHLAKGDFLTAENLRRVNTQQQWSQMFAGQVTHMNL